ncbi:PE-PPE domain-containing protein [[Mycobacterium] zoologicum]|uniref:PE-PPE domain-containing protein n=1 Tax=[Mycobacterium] zoologicum TaxID=2872311 RepID=UPI001CDACBB8|nr:PE-PPE domain-containing protein [Mycolicibacter sp. MYC101]MEB3064056.1 PE-PPE domain-containing protein [Mycolicibacter sp. MYC101]
MFHAARLKDGPIRYDKFSHLAAAGVIVAATGLAISPPAGALNTDALLLATTGPLAGSVTALILGGTGQPTPSPEYARSAEELYLNALGFNGGSTGSMVCHMDGTDPCSAPLQVLTTPELFQQSNAADALKLVLAVENEFNANPGAFDADHPLTIFGYSQSATAGSMAMEQLAAYGIPSDAMHFVFIGNPSNPDGVWQHLEAAMNATLGTQFTDAFLSFTGMDASLGSSTPNDLYPTTIYSLPDDPVANFVDSYAANGFWGALLNIFGSHVEYLGLTPEQIADATTTTDGLLTYVNINDDDINGFDAWLDALLFSGVANSDPFQSVWDSLVLLFTNSY